MPSSTTGGQVLALIPARGGSKSVPGKNLRLVAGKPLVVHSIEHALESRTITRVVVSTDDPEIAAVGKAAGAEVPFLRPAQLSGDFSLDYEYTRHALDWLLTHERYEPEIVVQLRPTTPLRRIADIDRAVELFRARPDADSLRAVTLASFTPYKMWRLCPDGLLAPLITLAGVEEPYNQPRQSLPDVYQQDGFIDIVRPRTIIEQQSITGRRILSFVLDRASVDIDYEHELDEAEHRAKEVR